MAALDGLVNIMSLSHNFFNIFGEYFFLATPYDITLFCGGGALGYVFLGGAVNIGTLCL